MATPAATAFGVIAGFLGIWSFGTDMMPSSEGDSSSYRVVIGLDGYKDIDEEKLSNAHGTIDTIKTYNINHELIGAGGDFSVGGDDSDDQYADTTVEQKGNSQSIWTEFYAGDDAICIAVITATMDEGTHWGWTGDWGYWCGLDWFPSGYELENDKGEEELSPKCTWIDKDHSIDIKAAAIGINWSKLKAGDSPPGDRESLVEACGQNMLAWDNEGGSQILPVEDRKKRSLVRRSQRTDDRLVISSISNHNATEVCESWTSRGPDFVSIREGVYCNMETHKTMPLCDGKEKTVDCFDLNTSHGPAAVRRNGKRSPRNPSRVIHWGQ